MVREYEIVNLSLAVGILDYIFSQIRCFWKELLNNYMIRTLNVRINK